MQGHLIRSTKIQSVVIEWTAALFNAIFGIYLVCERIFWPQMTWSNVGPKPSVVKMLFHVQHCMHWIFSATEICLTYSRKVSDILSDRPPKSAWHFVRQSNYLFVHTASVNPRIANATLRLIYIKTTSARSHTSLYFWLYIQKLDNTISKWMISWLIDLILKKS